MLLNILIVEDEPMIAHDLEAIVEDAGYAVVGVVRSMKAALAKAETNRCEVALVDIALGSEEDGIETARRLRDEFGVRSLFVTAHVTRRAEAMDLAWRPIGFVAKPYIATEILKALATIDQSSTRLPSSM